MEINEECIIRKVSVTFIPKHDYPGLGYQELASHLDIIDVIAEFYNAPDIVTRRTLLRNDSISLMELELNIAVEELIKYVKVYRAKEAAKISSEEVHNYEQSS